MNNSTQIKTISVIGLGYIGLPTAAMFASKEKKVIGIDINKDVVKTINAGRIHIVEPDLDLIIDKAVKKGFLKTATVPEPADAFLIAVPTPFLPKNSDEEIPEPDLSFIKSATEAISGVLKKGDIIILESTSPVGTTEKISSWLSKKRTDLTFPHTHHENSDIRIAYCPERVLPGQIVKELITNDRVIGGMTAACSKKAIEIYKIFVEGNCLITDAKTAEMSKLTENASRDVGIAFANELSIICDELGIDVWELIKLSNHHPRVNILEPGPGVGGHCIAVDPWFIVSKNPDTSPLIKTARQVNDYKPSWVIKKIKNKISDFLSKNENKTITDITIGCFGLAFKPNIDDLRESPALNIAISLSDLNVGKILVVEPNIKKLPLKYSKTFELVDLDFALTSSDILILLVDHDEFKTINNFPSDKIIIDTKGIWNLKTL